MKLHRASTVGVVVEVVGSDTGKDEGRYPVRGGDVCCLAATTLFPVELQIWKDE